MIILRTALALVLAAFLLSSPEGKALAQKEKDKGDKASKYTFEVYKDKANEWRWRLRSSNGQLVASSTGAYPDEKAVDAAIEHIKKDLDKYKFEVFEDTSKEFRWRLTDATGKVVAGPGEGYKNKADAERGMEFLKAAKDAPVIPGKP
jgi:uncharacterized protein YegP (UPF0339 family)